MAEEQKQKMVDDPFEVLEEMAKIGKVTKEVTLSDSMKITLQSLEADDESKVFVYADEFEGEEFFQNYKREIIVYSIKTINGKPVKNYEDIVDSVDREQEKKRTIEKLRLVLKKWKKEVLDYVYEKYQEMVSESKEEMKKFGIEPKSGSIDEVISNLEQVTQEIEAAEGEEQKDELDEEKKDEEEEPLEVEEVKPTE